MTTSKGLTVSVKIDGLTEKLAVFAKMGDKRKIGNDFLRIGSAQIAADMVGWASSEARAQGRQAQVFIPFIRVKTDRVPVVQVAPTGKLFKGSSHGFRETYRELAGSEFGNSPGAGHGFQPYVKAAGGRGGAGHWFFPAAQAHQAEVGARWNEVADAIVAAADGNTL